MPALHLFSNTTLPASAEWCLRRANRTDAILFVDEPTELALVHNALAICTRVYQLTPNQGSTAESLPVGVQTINYTTWVELSCEFEKVISW